MSTEAAQATVKQQPFITLSCRPRFVLHWTGGPRIPDLDKVAYLDTTVKKFLPRLVSKMLGIKETLNAQFDRILVHLVSPSDTRFFLRKVLGYAAWAYAQACELRPVAEMFAKLPENHFYGQYIFTLEEIYTKCFALAHIVGDEDEAMVGLRGLLTDFENTGVLADDGKVNEYGIGDSLRQYFVAYFHSQKLPAIRYARFADLMSATTSLVLGKFPLAKKILSEEIASRIFSEDCGFGRKDITSPEKTAMLGRLDKLVQKLKTTG